jgi:hypothetical protein
MAATASDLAAIEAALFKGEARVTFADRSVEYRSVDDLMKARDAIRAELSARPKQTLIVSSKGFR